MKENFGNVYDAMSHNYGELERLLGYIYEYMQNNPNDEFARDMFNKVNIIGQNMIFSQKEFTSSYCEESIKDNLIENLDSKVEFLKKNDEEFKSISR